MSEWSESLLWLDIETTGLDPERCSILEIGAILTWPNMSVISSYDTVVRNIPIDGLFWESSALKMHIKSGLIDRLDEGRNLSHVQRDLWDLCAGHEVVLAGSSVHFDRRWLRHHLPDFESWLGYRHFDVSSLWRACVMAGYTIDVEEKSHNVLDDLNRSMSVARQCVNYLKGRADTGDLSNTIRQMAVTAERGHTGFACIPAEELHSWADVIDFASGDDDK